MSSKPDDPHRPASDDAATQGPHPEDAIPSLPEAKSRSDSEIDLHQPGEEDLSGISVIEWAKLVEPPDSKAGLDKVTKTPSEVDLADLESAALPEPAKLSTGSDSSIDLSEPEMPVTGDDPRASGIELDDDSEVERPGRPRVEGQPTTGPVQDSSSIELGDPSLAGGSSVVSNTRNRERAPEKPTTASTVSDSEIDLGDPARAPARGKRESDVNFLGEKLILDPSSGVSSGSGSPPRMAEVSDSDIHEPGERPTPEGTGDSIEDDFLKKPDNEEESSSVDLGSMQSIPVFDAPEEYADRSTTRMEQPLPEFSASSSEIDLDPTAPPRPKPVPGSLSEVSLDDDSAPDISLLEKKPAKKATSVGRVLEPVPDEPEVKPPPRSKVATAVGGLACALTGAVVALGGAYTGGFLAPAGGSGQKQGSIATDTSQKPVTMPHSSLPTIDTTLNQIRTGDFHKITEADLEKIDAAKAEQIVARAHYRWLKYQLVERGKDPRATLKLDAEPVKQAMTDLEQAISANHPEASADALFLRAEIHELTGNEAAARTDYQAGATKFASDPTQKLRFETALQLLVLESSRKVSRSIPAVPVHLAILLVAFQPPGETAPAMPAEAGFAFWQAVQQAKAGKYAEAVKLLDDARNRHDQRRYLMPKKQQNPLSDPRERIFLNSCDELKAYWSLLARLDNPNYLTADAKDRVAKVDVLLAQVGKTGGASALKELSAKLAKDKTFATIDDLVKFVDAERKAKDDAIVTRDATVGEQKKEIATLGNKLKEASATLVKTRETLQSTEANLKQSQSANDDAVAALKQVAKEVSSAFTDVKTSKDTLLRDVRGTVQMAKAADPKGTILKLERDLAADRARLAERWEPTQMLAVWLALLDRDRDNKPLAARAEKDAERVLARPSTGAEVKGRAMLVQGLAMRNMEQFRAAIPVLTKAQESLRSAGNELRQQCESALQEVTNPAATVAARASDLEAQGRSKEAMDLIARGLGDLTTNKGPLLVQRCKIAFEAARSKGALAAGDPLVTAARTDAAAAVKEGLAEGHYCLGRLDEELGQLGDAERSYRAALKGHAKLDADGSRYRVALARVLLRQRGGTAPRAWKGSGLHFASLQPLGLFVSLTLQGGPAALAAGEAEALADEVLAMGDKAPVGARAQALAVKGLHTRAVNLSITGLRDSHKLAPEQANNLLELVNSHPGLRQTETLTRADPMKAERHYSAGVTFFFARQYPRAEKELLAAVENDSGDARYFYFLGLARLAQNKQEAYEDFEQGARLEEANRPYRSAVSAALERVQGRLRRVLNEVRAAPVIEKPK